MTKTSVTGFGRAWRINAAVLLLPMLLGCEQEPDADPVTVWADSAGVVIARSHPALAPACSLASEPRIEIGTAAGDPTQELYGVYGAGILSTGEIAVLNWGTMGVRLYNAQGELVRSFGRKGGGPGEFESVFGLWILPGDTIWVGDRRPWRYEVYTAEGEWVRSVEPEPLLANPPDERGMLEGGRPVLGDQEPQRADRTFPQTWLRVVLYGATGAALDTLGRFPYGRRGRTVDDPRAIIMYPYFEPTAELAAAGQRVAIGLGSEPQVSVFDVPNDVPLSRGAFTQPAMILQWTPEDRTVTADDIAAEKERIRRHYAEASPRLQEMARDLVRDTRPAADSFPAYFRLMFGTDGSLWVSEYPRPGSNNRHRLIFGSDGHLRCRLSTIAGLQFQEVGTDYVLAKHEDDLGVERVVLFDLLEEPD